MTFNQTAIPVVSGSGYTTSIYLKGNGRTRVQLQYFGQGTRSDDLAVAACHRV